MCEADLASGRGKDYAILTIGGPVILLKVEIMADTSSSNTVHLLDYGAGNVRSVR